MTARELELLTALQALELRLLALLDSRTAAMWSLLPSPPVCEKPADEAQARGEVARNDGSVNQWQGVRSPDTHPATYEDLGLSRQRVAEWRELRDAADEARP